MWLHAASSSRKTPTTPHSTLNTAHIHLLLKPNNKTSFTQTKSFHQKPFALHTMQAAFLLPTARQPSAAQSHTHECHSHLRIFLHKNQWPLLHKTKIRYIFTPVKFLYLVLYHTLVFVWLIKPRNLDAFPVRRRYTTRFLLSTNAKKNTTIKEIVWRWKFLELQSNFSSQPHASAQWLKPCAAHNSMRP